MQRNSFICDNIHLFPYEKIRFGEEVVIYGFGKVGQQYFNQISANGYCNIKYIVDEKWEEYAGLSIPVKTPQSLIYEQTATIVIALNCKSKAVLDNLTELGIPAERIVYHDTFMGNPLDINEAHIVDIIEMTEEEANKHFGKKCFEQMCGIREMLNPVGINHNFVRIGAKNDGGYVMLDNTNSREKIAYSFGINNDVSWDEDMANCGYEIYMYDHTIDCLPKDRKEFHFFKKGLADSKTIGDTDMGSLDDYIIENGHQSNEHMILKMDVEGAEWDGITMANIETLSKFDQIVLEFHGLLNTSKLDIMEEALKKLTFTHYVIHLHANNSGSVIYVDGRTFPDVLEVTLVKKDSNMERLSYEGMLPLELDSPCWREFPEIVLNRWI